MATTVRSVFALSLLIALGQGVLAAESSGRASESRSDLLVRAEGSGAVLSLGRGAPFHRTDNEVLDAHLIDVQDASVRVALWQEVLPDGQVMPWYAISLNGQTMATVRQTSYTLKVRYSDFDPEIQTPVVPAALSAADGSGLHIVQFVTQSLEAYRATVEALGGDVLPSLANHAHVVRMSPEVRDAVAELPFVRWVGPFHTAYKLEEEILSQLQVGAVIEARRYSIMTFERSLAAQHRVGEQIEALGGEVHGYTPNGSRLEATLTLEQVHEIATLDDVMFIDRKGEVECDMDIVRIIGGADFLEFNTPGEFRGEGVRAEVCDTELNVNHVEWSAPPIIHLGGGGTAHGTSVYSILFAQGVNPSARGLIPSGVGIFANSSSLLGGGPTRYQHTLELVDPAGPYRAVLQTNSTGDPRTLFYTTISAEMDEILFDLDFVICQSQSNAGATGNPQDSRPQAWAKNIISGGAVNHLNTLDRSDDRWLNPGGTSTGPASDGRVKPTLAGFYDGITAATSSGGYTQFGGTSGGTPIVAGHAGLVFQMWHEGVFEGFGGGPTVFDSRPHMTTIKALLVNTAYRYDWNSGGQNASLDRFKQGWGWPDVKELYNMRDNMSIINESEFDLLSNLDSISYFAYVAPSEPALRATLVYADPPGVPFSSQHRVNDVTLKVTAPDNTVYWGNNGLLDDNWSTPGGDPNIIDTVENVFIPNPEAGVWTIEVIASEIVEDGHVETPELDVDFALVVTGAPPGPTPPRANDLEVSTAVSTPATFTLEASDDGEPIPPGALTYLVTRLPDHGDVSDPGNGPITSIPYTLVNNGNQVDYAPVFEYAGPDSFDFRANDGGVPPEGGDSNPAVVSITVGGLDWDPVANNMGASTPLSTPVDITLSATDPNGDTLTYIIESLPPAGSLSDPGAGPIETAPYTLVGGGDIVTYTPPFDQYLQEPFGFSVQDATAGSNLASVSVTVGGALWDPVAQDMLWGTAISLPTDIELSASDPNGDPLTYFIETLPDVGGLSDPDAGVITSVPYTLVGGGNIVTFTPPWGQTIQAMFDFSVRDATAGSNVATVTVDVGVEHAIFSFLMDSDPSWGTTGQWAFGQPTGNGSRNPDPTSGYTGNNVLGYNLDGDYENNMPLRFLTTGPIDCTYVVNAELRFRRWLGVESSFFDQANIQISTNGLMWSNLWVHDGNAIEETSWTLRTFDISSIADNKPAVFIRWGMGPTDTTSTYSGWNLDDILIWGLDTTPVPLPCGEVTYIQGDVNLDDSVNGLDVQTMVQMLLNPVAAWSVEQLCAGDFTDDDAVTLADVDAFVLELLNPAP